MNIQSELWRGMPEYEHEQLTPQQSIKIHFASIEDSEAFAKLHDQPISDNTRSLWYPEAEIGHYADKRYTSDSPLVPRYPVYIISKGRWESRPTSRALEQIGVP